MWGRGRSGSGRKKEEGRKGKGIRKEMEMEGIRERNTRGRRSGTGDKQGDGGRG